MRRRYVVKMVTSWPGWTGTVWAYGCKHLASAEALFERREIEVSPGSYSALLLIDRQEQQVLRSKGTKVRVVSDACRGTKISAHASKGINSSRKCHHYSGTILGAWPSPWVPRRGRLR